MDEKKQIIIERIFNAPREMVWKAWTDPEMVKEWWGPEGFYAPSVKVDFRVGGKYIYAMHGPAGSEWDKDMYSAGIYKEIVPNEKLVVTDYFSDSEGNMIDPTEEGQGPDMPKEMTVLVKFEDFEEDGPTSPMASKGQVKTKLSIIYTAENDQMYEGMIKSGMREGWATSLDKMAKVVEGK